jgi:hypothetical protein
MAMPGCSQSSSTPERSCWPGTGVMVTHLTFDRCGLVLLQWCLIYTKHHRSRCLAGNLVLYGDGFVSPFCRAFPDLPAVGVARRGRQLDTEAAMF